MVRQGQMFGAGAPRAAMPRVALQQHGRTAPPRQAIQENNIVRCAAATAHPQNAGGPMKVCVCGAGGWSLVVLYTFRSNASVYINCICLCVVWPHAGHSRAYFRSVFSIYIHLCTTLCAVTLQDAAT